MSRPGCISRKVFDKAELQEISAIAASLQRVADFLIQRCGAYLILLLRGITRMKTNFSALRLYGLRRSSAMINRHHNWSRWFLRVLLYSFS